MLGLVATASPDQIANTLEAHAHNDQCIQANRICPGWAIDHIDRYLHPALEHIVLVVISVALGFVIAMGLAILSHRYRWFHSPIAIFTGVLFTIPSVAFFILLLPVTGRGNTTAVIALTCFTLQILYRNIITGLRNVPIEARESGRGMGMTERQLLFQVEIPLAVPEIIAGLRVATVSTVAIATLAVVAGGGGLGSQILNGSDVNFKTGIVIAGGLAILIAIGLDLLLVFSQRFLSPWRRVRPV
jgi:osmoprotectant transport system permease protein